MSAQIERAVFTVSLTDGMWAVEHDGKYFDHSKDKEVAKAAANRRAREAHNEGRPSKVQVTGEIGFFAAS
jgi:hypothetical protein